VIDSFSLMPFGPHKGRRLIDVSSGHLLDLYDEAPAEFAAEQHGIELKVAKELWAYINANREYLEHDVAEWNLKRRVWSQAKQA
jgi:uncharacterized protein (DUF3820 family)